MTTSEYQKQKINTRESETLADKRRKFMIRSKEEENKRDYRKKEKQTMSN